MATVLVVEDNPDLREMYQEILALEAHGVRMAENADEAVREIESQKPDVLVLDLGIAGGIERILKAAGPEPRAILASGARDLPERAVALGAAAYLLKPFGPEQLLTAVAKVIAPR